MKENKIIEIHDLASYTEVSGREEKNAYVSPIIDVTFINGLAYTVDASINDDSDSGSWEEWYP